MIKIKREVCYLLWIGLWTLTSDIHNELVELLQTVVISSTDDDVSEDALQLLCDYEWPPFEILEKNINRVSQRLKPDVLYAVNMDKEI